MKINPFANSNPMSWKDAARVSLILTTAVYFTAFLLPFDIDSIMCEYYAFIFESIKFYGSVFFTNFIALAGLAQYTKGKISDEPSTKKD